MALIETRFADSETAAQALAGALVHDLDVALQSQPRALLLVSGGRSPQPVFSSLARASLAWERIDLSLVDERAVPPRHPDANAALVAQHLLVGPVRRARWIPLVEQTDAGSSWECAQRAVRRANAEPGLARPAAIVLGMGADGHTASLFPDSPHWRHASETEERYVALQPGVAPHARVSLSLHALAGQGKCYLWVVGAAKSDTLLRVKTLAEEVERGGLPQPALLEAGPLAMLIAIPKVSLHAFLSP
jgi:6-phosphogluconolactonase